MRYVHTLKHNPCSLVWPPPSGKNPNRHGTGPRRSFAQSHFLVITDFVLSSTMCISVSQAINLRIQKPIEDNKPSYRKDFSQVEITLKTFWRGRAYASSQFIPQDIFHSSTSCSTQFQWEEFSTPISKFHNNCRPGSYSMLFLFYKLQLQRQSTALKQNFKDLTLSFTC